MSGVVRYPTCPRPRVEEHGIIITPLMWSKLHPRTGTAFYMFFPPTF